MARKQQTPNRNTSGGGHGAASSGDAKSQDKTPVTKKESKSTRSPQPSKPSPNAINAQRRRSNKTAGTGNSPPGHSTTSGNSPSGHSTTPGSIPSGHSTIAQAKTPEPDPKLILQAIKQHRKSSTTKGKPGASVKKFLAGRTHSVAVAAVAVASRITSVASIVKPKRLATLQKQLEIDMNDDRGGKLGAKATTGDPDIETVIFDDPAVLPVTPPEDKTSPLGKEAGMHPPLPSNVSP